jgi:hypothetical protein
MCFTGRGSRPLAQLATWRTRVSHLVWAITLDLSGMGDPYGSKATAGIALGITWQRKPHHYDKVETPMGGPTTTTKWRYLWGAPPLRRSGDTYGGPTTTTKCRYLWGAPPLRQSGDTYGEPHHYDKLEIPMGGPTTTTKWRYLCGAHHYDKVEIPMGAPPLRQSGDTYGGLCHVIGLYFPLYAVKY